MSENKLSGLIAAPHTPMHDDYSINYDTISVQADLSIGNELSGVFLCGSTGEGMSLTLQERMNVVERWNSELKGKIAIIVHVGHHCIVDAKELAAHAEQEIKARAISAVAPSYYKPATVEDLVVYCSEIASAAPDTPFYFYHQPGKSGVNFPMIKFIPLAEKLIPTFEGIKYTHGDLLDFGRCVSYKDGKFAMLFGQDENLICGLSLGAKGAVGSTYNFAAPLYQQIIKSFEEGDMETARNYQSQSQELVSVLVQFRPMEAIKSVMKAIGIDCGPSRPPMRSLSKEEYETLYMKLEEIGFFSYCSKVHSLLDA